MKLDFTAVFRGGSIPGWLQAFAANPGDALHDLLLNRADLGYLAVADPVEVGMREFSAERARRGSL